MDDERITQRAKVPDSMPEMKRVQETIKEIHIPMNFSRHNSGIGHSISLGRVSDRYHHKMGNGRYDSKYPELKKAIWALGKKIVPFPFTTVQVNYNYKTKPHIDGHNVGNSLILGFGDYSGGDLVVSGKSYNIKNTPTIFNGSLHLHSTKPYTGERYSLVFFKQLEFNWK